MRFDTIAKHLTSQDPTLRVVNNRQSRVVGVTDDSRKVRKGEVFAALPGTKADGTQFVEAAIAAGAKALLVARELPIDLPQLVSEKPRRTLAHLAALFNGQPAQNLRMVGVTGTKGKTTVAFAMREIFEACRVSCGLIGTVENIVGSEHRVAAMTTPSALEVQRLLAEMRARGQGACAMEVSSHALDQDRVAGIPFAGAIFTNLGHDHLDYHIDFDSYFNAKARLFEESPGISLINMDDPHGDRMCARARGPVLRYGTSEKADVRLTDLRMALGGMSFDVHFRGRVERFESIITGRYNAMNLTACIGMALALELPIEGIRSAVARFRGAPGRLERVPCSNGPLVFVDYAHTPDSLENVLGTMREVCAGQRLTCVFGCGGDRDRTKRPKMGAIAAAIADRVIVTSDNPRSEAPESILEQIIAGIPPQKRPVDAIVDRRDAIELAIREAKPGEVVLIAGKGHEPYQIFKDRTAHFDDREEAAAALAKHWNSAAGSRREKVKA